MKNRITKEEHLVLKEQRKPKTVPLTINGYSTQVEKSGDILCTYICFRPVVMKELMLIVGDAPKKEQLSVVIHVSNTKDRTERTVRFPVKKGEHHIQIPAGEQSLKHKDKIAVSIEFSGESPRDVWAAAFGDILI
jgi:hypothetical protein